MSMEGRETVDHNGEVEPIGDVLYPIKRYFSQSAKYVHLLSLDAIKKTVKYMEVKYGKKLPDLVIATAGEVAAIEVNADNRSVVIGLLESLKLNEQFKFSLVDEWIDFPKKEGTQFYVIYKDEVRYKFNSWLRKSVGGSCIKCMSSFYGAVTLLPTFIYIFGLRWEVIPVLLFDIFCLVYVNMFFKQ